MTIRRRLLCPLLMLLAGPAALAASPQPDPAQPAPVQPGWGQADGGQADGGQAAAGQPDGGQPPPASTAGTETGPGTGPGTGPETPPGLVSARLLPGWTTADGHRISALQLALAPGWKTYWRSPGDAGVPPRFDWTGSGNVGRITLHWPRPEAIESGGERTLGYHDGLVLPVEVEPADPARPVDLRLRVDFGLCADVCVPARVDLAAPPPGAGPDPLIEAALARVPRPAPGRATCAIAPIADGVRVTARFPGQTAPEVAIEPADESIWVSQPELAQEDGALRAQADFVAASGKPFPLDPQGLRLTLILPDDAIEFRGCDTRRN